MKIGLVLLTTLLIVASTSTATMAISTSKKIENTTISYNSILDCGSLKIKGDPSKYEEYYAKASSDYSNVEVGSGSNVQLNVNYYVQALGSLDKAYLKIYIDNVEKASKDFLDDQNKIHEGTLSATVYMTSSTVYTVKIYIRWEDGDYAGNRWNVGGGPKTDELKITTADYPPDNSEEFAVYGDYPRYWSDAKSSLRGSIDVCNTGSRYSLLDWSIISKKEVGDPYDHNKIYGVGINVDKTSGDDLKNEQHYNEKHTIHFELTNLPSRKIMYGIHSVVKIEIIFKNDNYPSLTQTATIEIYVYHGSKALNCNNILHSKFPLINSLLSKIPSSFLENRISLQKL
jgi:hypothetical protein